MGTFSKCRTDNHDGVLRLLPQRAGALTDIALLRLSGGWLSASELHCFETASSVLRVKALNFNWSRASTVGTVYSLCITRIAPLDTTWCHASGSPIEPEGLPCTSHWVLLCTRIADHELCAFIFGNTCSLCLSISPSTMDLETMIRAEIQSEDELTQSLIERS